MPRRRRKHIPLAQQLAAALACLLPQETRDDLRRRRVPAREVIRLFSPDHIALHALGGADAWWNIDPKLREPHAIKSRKDTGIVAKVRRIQGRVTPEASRLLLPKPKRRKARSQWPSRKFSSRRV